MAKQEIGVQGGTVVLGRERGNFLEDFRPGQVFEHWPGRTITEADNVLFTTLTMNTQALHLDAAFADGRLRTCEFGGDADTAAVTRAVLAAVENDTARVAAGGRA